MLKSVLFVSALTVAVPAFAQGAAPAPSEPQTTAPAKKDSKKMKSAPTATQAPTTAAAPAMDATPAPAEQAAAPAPMTQPSSPTAVPAQAAAATAPAAAQPADVASNTAATTTANTATTTPAAAAAPVTGASQIAQVVTTEFPTYDKNSDTSLDRTEFGSWMVALKTASDPATKATDPATVKWVDGAFASADTDSSKTVSQAELTTYLSKGQ